VQYPQTNMRGSSVVPSSAYWPNMHRTCENFAQLSHWIIGQGRSSVVLQTQFVESLDWPERSVSGVFVLDDACLLKKVGEGGEGNLVMSIMELNGIGFVTARRAALMVALGSD